jgi:hypothetical protein
MSSLLIVIFIIAVLAALIKLGLPHILGQLQESKGSHRYKSVPLVTPTEHKFLRVLDAAVVDQYRIFTKVRLADIINPVKTKDDNSWQSAFNRIQSKHVDFVLCDPNSLEVKFIVELDDSSHNRPDRSRRDEFLSQALHVAGLTLIRFPAQNAYSAAEIKNKLIHRA